MERRERKIRFPNNIEERAYCMRRMLEEKAKSEFPKGTRISFCQFDNSPDNTGLILVWPDLKINLGSDNSVPQLYGMVTPNGSPLANLQYVAINSPYAYSFRRELDAKKKRKA